MTKQKAKTKETVILLRIPDVEARSSEGSITIQRGDLGHLQQFNYTGLTLRGNIAEAVQNALIALAKLEANPPKFTPDTPTQTDGTDTPDTPLDENAAEPDDDTGTNEEEEAEDTKVISDTSADAEPSPRITSAPHAVESAIPANTDQMSLF
ncbi:MAG: hypothetical protein BroJett018_22250 [Chloroflexota bacterium]|nr:hypothetical protein [Chloroflexota bacterium]NOG66124.1 hypothetical protein [Chloroflexota bacterium]GIK64431.1 MAG: hypothetical protein BroJett018_22250 [Chloroflexota bacterium]